MGLDCSRLTFGGDSMTNMMTAKTVATFWGEADSFSSPFAIFFTICATYMLLYLGFSYKRLGLKPLIFTVLFAGCSSVAVLAADNVLLAPAVLGIGLLLFLADSSQNPSHESIKGMAALLSFFVCGSILFLIPLLELNTSLSSGPNFWLESLQAACFCLLLAAWPLHIWLFRVTAKDSFLPIVWVSTFVAPLGCYGFYRFVLPLSGESVLLGKYFVAAGVVGALVASLVALTKRSMLEAVVYLMVSKASFLVLTLGVVFSKSDFFSQASQGGLIQVFSVALTVPAFCFLLASFRAGVLEKILLSLLVFALLGAPGTAGYWANAWMSKAIWGSGSWAPYVLVFLFFLWSLVAIRISTQVWFGAFMPSSKAVQQRSRVELTYLALPLAALIVVGFMPSVYVQKAAPSLPSPKILEVLRP